jgi:hypothetical protein
MSTDIDRFNQDMEASLALQDAGWTREEAATEPAITTIIDSKGVRRLNPYEQTALTPDVLDTIRLALMDKSEQVIGRLCRTEGMQAAYWAGELWQIDRARRALAIED